MNQTEYIVSRLEEVLTKGEWVTGTNYLKEIKDLNWQIAVATPNGLNSVAGLVFHINYYLEGVNTALKDGVLEISDANSFDGFAVSNETEWKALVMRFEMSANRFIETVRHLFLADLQECFFKAEYGTVLRNIDVMVEHCYYHLGQIRLIKKLSGV